MNISDEKEFGCTYNQNVLSPSTREVDEDLSPALHEEADTKMFLHVAHCINPLSAEAANLAGYKSIPMCTARQIGWLIILKLDFEQTDRLLKLCHYSSDLQEVKCIGIALKCRCI